MSRKNRKKASPTSWFKDLFTGLIRFTIVITIFLSGNDYQITTVIQLNASNHEASGAPADLRSFSQITQSNQVSDSCFLPISRFDCPKTTYYVNQPHQWWIAYAR